MCGNGLRKVLYKARSGGGAACRLVTAGAVRPGAPVQGLGSEVNQGSLWWGGSQSQQTGPWLATLSGASDMGPWDPVLDKKPDLSGWHVDVLGIWDK